MPSASRSWLLPALALAALWACELAVARPEGRAAPGKPDGVQPVLPKPVALFNGKDLSGWVSRRGGPARWKVEDGYIEVVPGTGDIYTERKFGDCRLQLEFWVPSMPNARGEKRGNSGVYFQGRHEIQILDSFENPTHPTTACGALYGLIAPLKNASKAPEVWQSLDITFVAPRVDAGGRVVKKGEITVLLNGVKVLDKAPFDRTTPNGAGSRVSTSPLDHNIGAPGPIMLQDHAGSRSRVRFRNLAVRPVGNELLFGIEEKKKK